MSNRSGFIDRLRGIIAIVFIAFGIMFILVGAPLLAIFLFISYVLTAIRREKEKFLENKNKILIRLEMEKMKKIAAMEKSAARKQKKQEMQEKLKMQKMPETAK